jgi:hypothetical protein
MARNLHPLRPRGRAGRAHDRSNLVVAERIGEPFRAPSPAAVYVPITDAPPIGYGLIWPTGRRAARVGALIDAVLERASALPEVSGQGAVQGVTGAVSRPR